TQWSLIKPKRVSSRGGARLTVSDDGSVLASGPNPATDTYTVELEAGRNSVTGILLEALPHSSLPAQGPGRSINGNIVLTDIRLSLQPVDGSRAPLPVKLTSAFAEFSQKGFPVTNAIDGDPKSGWAIHPQVGKSLTAFFGTEQRVA